MNAAISFNTGFFWSKRPFSSRRQARELARKGSASIWEVLPVPACKMAIGVIERVHKSVAQSFKPRKIILVLCITSTVVSVKITVHPALHRTQIHMREAMDGPGTM